MVQRRSFLGWTASALASLLGIRSLSTARPDAWTDSTATASNVRAYGARGDGVTDDTKAIQLAFDRADSGAVVVPPGVYAVGELKILRQISVRAEGATFVATPGHDRTARLIEITADGVEIRHLTLDGRDGQCAYGVYVTRASGLRLEGLQGRDFGESFIRISGCRDSSLKSVRAERCQMNEDTPRSGVIRLQASQGIDLEDIRIANGQGKGLAFGDSERCTVTGLHVERQLAQGGTCLYFNNSHQIEVRRGVLHLPENHAVKISRGSSFIRVSDVHMFTDHGEHPPARPTCLLIQGGSDCTISNCTFTTKGEGANRVVRIQDHPAGYDCFRNTVEACTIVATTDSPSFRGVEFLGSDSQGDNRVVDCVIRAGQGVNIVRGTGNAVVGCRIVATTYGVYSRGTSKGTTIERCLIESTSHGTVQGIRVEAPGARISDNIIRVAGSGNCILFTGSSARDFLATRNTCHDGDIATAGGAAGGRVFDNRVLTASSSSP